MRKEVHKFCRVCHLRINLAVLRRNQKTCQSINHETIYFIHSVLEIERADRFVHEAVMKNNSLKYRPRVQLKLFSSFDEPFNEHLAHLGNVGKLATGADCYLLGYTRGAPRAGPRSCTRRRLCARFLSSGSSTGSSGSRCEAPEIPSRQIQRSIDMLRRTYLREEDATFATVCNAFVPKQVRVGTGVGSQSGDALSNLPFLALILILWRLRRRSLR